MELFYGTAQSKQQVTASKEASKYEPSILCSCKYLVLGGGVCLLKQPSFFQNGETHPLEVRWEKRHFYYNFLECVLR